MTFATLQLHGLIVRNLAAMGYEEPRPIQERTIPPILEGSDVIGLAQTGTGKTAAFIAPVAHHLITNRPPHRKGRLVEPRSRLRAIVLCPTRELAQQVADEAAEIVQGTVLRVACAYGKVAITPQIEALSRGVDLLVATPGRLRELLDSHAVTLEHVKHVVIDEADRMLDMGFLPQVSAILESIPAERQMLLFTATMPGEVESLAREFLREPVRVEAGKHSTPVAHVEQHLLPVHDKDKVPLLLHLIEGGGRPQAKRRGVLVFCRTRRRVGWVGTALERNSISVGMLHGDRSQLQRQRALDRFAAGELRVLVATDVAARGLHVPAVKFVVNYDLPLSPEEYVHRIGRAAHGGPPQRGESFTFLSESDRLRWRAILDKLGVEVFAETVEGFVPSVKVVKPARVRRDATRQASSDVKGETGGRTKRRRGAVGAPKRSRKGRPIKPGQKPGAGVKKLSSRQ